MKKTITVPFPYQSTRSGIGLTGYHPCVWYRRDFNVPAEWVNGRVLLHFGAVDYLARVWINGQCAGEHRGGHVPFRFDVTRWVSAGENEITVRAIDTLDVGQPRGKQSWAEPFGCWYTPTTGIWQSVWLESVPETYIRACRVNANPLDGSVSVTVIPNQPDADLVVRATAARAGSAAAEASAPLEYPSACLRMRIPGIAPWSPEDPVLYDLALALERNGQVVDSVCSYFGARSVSVRGGQICLNGRPYYQRLVLDQGFWPDGLYTAPSDDALKADIELARAMGFNGCRKHQKVEDPRFLYWADRLGFLVWAEFPAQYEFTLGAQARFLPEWQAAVERDINHPSVVAWVPYNESWGLSGVARDPTVQDWVRQVVAFTRFLDPTRLVADNEGWEHVDSDIYGFHSYAPTGEELARDVENALGVARGQAAVDSSGNGRRRMMADGYALPAMPLMLTEFGGIGYPVGGKAEGAWGYGNLPAGPDEFRRRFEGLFLSVRGMRDMCGYVYTQLTDVQQEINGLLTTDRKPKLDPEWVRRRVEGAS